MAGRDFMGVEFAKRWGSSGAGMSRRSALGYGMRGAKPPRDYSQAGKYVCALAMREAIGSAAAPAAR